MRDHKLYVEEITQRLSSHPVCKMSRAVLPETAFQQVEKVMASHEFRAIQNRRNNAEVTPRHDEVWRIAFRDGPTRFFTFNAQSLPPASFVAWFDDASRLRPSENVPLGQIPTDVRCFRWKWQMRGNSDALINGRKPAFAPTVPEPAFIL